MPYYRVNILVIVATMNASNQNQAAVIQLKAVAQMQPYKVEIEINLPRDEVVKIFDNQENMFHWQNGLQDIQHLSGQPGQNGAKSLMIYQNGKHRIELTETITNRNLPNEFDGCYEWGGGKNTLKNRFVEMGGNKTRWESTCEYEFKTLFLKLMGTFMPGLFKKQNMKFLENFKAFCETGKSVQDN